MRPTPTTVRANFVQAFGEAEAPRIEIAANGHGNGINDKNRGSDHFKWALLICIGYECCEKPAYRKHHGIRTSWKKIKRWIKEHGKLGSHVGDCDYLCLMSGGYNEFVGKGKKNA